MSLLKQKKENDRIAAEAAAKAKEEALLRELAMHPVVKAGCGRDVRDAYFLGLVFAAIADDEKVDADERAILDGIAKSLSFGEGEVDDAITSITKMSVDDKLQLIEECVCAIKEHEPIVKLFYAQFAELWMTGEYDLDELKDWVGRFRGWTGVELSSEQIQNINAVVSNSEELDSALDDLATWMGNDVLKHFALHRYGDVTSRIEQAKMVKREAAEAAEAAKAKKRAIEEAREKVHALQDKGAKEFSAFYTLPSGWIELMRRELTGVEPGQIDFQEEVARVLMNCSVAKEKSSWSAWSSELRTEDDRERDRQAIWKMLVLVILKCPDVSSKSDRPVRELQELSKQKGARSIKEDLKNYAKTWLGFTEAPLSDSGSYRILLKSCPSYKGLTALREIASILVGIPRITMAFAPLILHLQKGTGTIASNLSRAQAEELKDILNKQGVYVDIVQD